MAKLSLTTITSRYASVDALNANFEAIEEALENTLSRDGTAPNVLEADIDVNGNRILNLPTPSTSGEPINLGWAVANYPDFQTVAGLADEIEALGDIVTEIVEVYNKRNSIVTVAGGISQVVDVGDNISAVSTVATNISNVNNVNTNIADVSTVATNIGSVNTTAGAISNVNTVAGAIASVNTVSGISSDVTAVALINGDVTTVSGISADVTTVAADGTDIGTVAANITNVNTVAGISGNVTTVAGDTANIGTIAGNIADVNTVAGISTDVSDVAGISTNVTTVAGIQSDVSTVASNNVNVSTVAANIVDVNAFADTYFISATAPGAPTAGDLWYDTSASSIRVYNGSTWSTIDAVDATSVNAAGAVMNTDTTTAAMSFVVDEDTFASNSDTKVPTQQSVKAYVDNATAAALHYHDPVRLESPVALSADYNNGTDGVGATLTNNSTQEALVIDGVAAVVNDRVLIYQQTNAAHNGVYTVTDIGSVSTNWVLTRATDADSYNPSDPDSFGTGDSFYVQEGNTGAGESYVLTTQGTITFGTTNLTFSQFSATPQYTGVDNIDITGFNVSFTTAGTPTAGQALIWDGGTSQWEPGDVTFTPYDANNNTYVGEDALSSLTTGTYNTAVGHSAGRDITTGPSNTTVGGLAGMLLTTGEGNTMLGLSAGSAVTTNGNNVAIGRNAYGLSTGPANVSIGYFAGYQNMLGMYNVNIGWEARGYPVSNYSGSNVAIGYQAQKNSTSAACIGIGIRAGLDSTGTHNVTIGTDAGRALVNSYGVHIGYQAGRNSTNAPHNVALGYQSLYSSANSYNTGIGFYAGRSISSGFMNITIGTQSGSGLTTGIRNTIVGNETYSNNVDSCTALGYQARSNGSYNTSIGYQASYSGGTGTYNTAVGYHANLGSFSGTHSYSTMVGAEAGSGLGNITGNYNVCIGYNAKPPSTSTIGSFTLGDSNITNLRCNDTSISSLSDERDKTNIQDISWGLDFINDVRPVSFEWNRRDGSMGNIKQVGFIAQDLYDVELTHSSVAHTRMVSFENPSKLEAAPMRMFPILVKAVQELSAKVNELQAEITALKGV